MNKKKLISLLLIGGLSVGFVATLVSKSVVRSNSKIETWQLARAQEEYPRVNDWILQDWMETADELTTLIEQHSSTSVDEVATRAPKITFWDIWEERSGIAFNIPNSQGFYTIHTVALHKKVTLVDPVVLKTYDIHVKSYEGLTALHYAAREGFLAFFESIQNVDGVNFSIKDQKKRTPLWYAKKYKHQDVVNWLEKTLISFDSSSVVGA